jgi:hypothetical protein
MIPFIIVKTANGFAYVRPERVVAISATDAGDCSVLLTDGVTIAASEPAEDIVARMEAESRDEDEHARILEERQYGHVAKRD